jgi:flagellar hook protein FlgE
MSFQQGLSGLSVTSKSLDVIGNNIANSSTFGAKSSRAEFADMYASAMSGSTGSSVGIGVRLANVAQTFSQGNISSTDNPLDVAINGGGFFQLTNNQSPPTYSRNGQFKVDKEGFVVNNRKQMLMGYMADSTGVIAQGSPQAIQLPTEGIKPQQTTKIKMELNLDSRVAVPTTTAFNSADPTSYNNATSLTVFDQDGEEVALTFYYKKVTESAVNGNDWDLYITANGAPVNPDGNTPPQPTPVQFKFQNSGAATDLFGSPLVIPPLTVPQSMNNGAETKVITPIALDINRTTQYGARFGVTDLSQDGYAPGQLVGLQIENNGVVTARYSNGQTKTAAQVELATFRNSQGLQPLGENGWASTFASGTPIRGIPGDGNFGTLQSGALEESNIDLTGELVNMITAQRMYQANAQTIKTQDQVLQTLVNLR